MVPHIIPGHITALYIFAVLNLMALFHITLVKADISILDKYNRTLEELQDLPARFGPPFPDGGLYGHVKYNASYNGCAPLPEAPKNGEKWFALLQRHGCTFEVKVHYAELAHYAAAIVFNNDSNQLIPMGGDSIMVITIPSVFIGERDAYELRQLCHGCFVLIDNRTRFNYNLYLLPFAIVVGICFLLMLIFMVAKWVRDVQKRRRARLSREHLKKLPTKKFKKGDPYDMCAICLDEYEEGEKLRILPCSHAYHMKCVDPWLTKNKRNCPVCKRKVIPGDEDDSDSDMTDDENDTPPSETTPLLTAQNAGQMGAHNTAFQNSVGALSDANSAHPEDIYSGDGSDSESDYPSGPRTSSIQVHSPNATTTATTTPTLAAAPAASRSGYGSLGHRQRQRQEEMDSNPEYRGAVGGVGVDITEDHYGHDSEEEMRGIVSSDAEDEDEEDEGRSLRVKIISLFKRKKRGGRPWREDREDA